MCSLALASLFLKQAPCYACRYSVSPRKDLCAVIVRLAQGRNRTDGHNTDGGTLEVRLAEPLVSAFWGEHSIASALRSAGREPDFSAADESALQGWRLAQVFACIALFARQLL